MKTETSVDSVLDRMRDMFEDIGSKDMGCFVYVFDPSFTGAGSGFHKNCGVADVINVVSIGYGINLTPLANNQKQYDNICATRDDIKEHCKHNGDNL